MGPRATGKESMNEEDTEAKSGELLPKDESPLVDPLVTASPARPVSELAGPAGTGASDNKWSITEASVRSRWFMA